MKDERLDAMLEVWNKSDLLSEEERKGLETVAARSDKICTLSALTGDGMETLFEKIDAGLAEPVSEENLTIGYTEGKARAWLFENNLVMDEAQDEEGYKLHVRWTERQKNKFAHL